MIEVTSLWITGSVIWTTAQSEEAARRAGLATGFSGEVPYIVIPSFPGLGEIDPGALPSQDIRGAQGGVTRALSIPTTREEARELLRGGLSSDEDGHECGYDIRISPDTLAAANGHTVYRVAAISIETGAEIAVRHGGWTYAVSAVTETANEEMRAAQCRAALMHWHGVR